MKSATHCVFCNHELRDTDFIGRTVICPNCSHSYVLESDGQILKVLAGVVGALALGLGSGWLWHRSQVGIFSQITDPVHLRELIKPCLGRGDLPCLEDGYARGVELDPHNVFFEANLAMVQTRRGEHRAALEMYRRLLAEKSLDTFDVMGAYGHSLVAVGNYKEAEKWLRRSLSIYPSLVDVMDDLAEVMIQQRRWVEAEAEIKAFIARYPSARGFLAGRLMTIQDQLMGKGRLEAKNSRRPG